jgi:outer membrane protein assembly factor BamB
MSGRHHRYQIVQDDTLGLYYYRGMRASCGPSMAAADGMLFASPINCICTPTHPYGFTTLASIGSDPTADELTSPKPVERGPAYGTLDTSVACSPWPMYRANAQRSSSSDVPSAYAFAPSWETRVFTRRDNGLVGHSLASRTLASLSPPVAGCGKLFVAVTDRGEVVALDEKSGAEAWRYRAGSRIETSPTVFRNAVFFGCNDGYVYALAADNGTVMWRTRLAPRERRMLEHGVVESVWPVYGAVLQYRGILFASAGRNSESDGGTVIVALDPATGTRKWSRQTDVVLMRKDDNGSGRGRPMSCSCARMTSCASPMAVSCGRTSTSTRSPVTAA